MVAAAKGPTYNTPAQWQERFTLVLERLAGNQVAVAAVRIIVRSPMRQWSAMQGGKPTVFICGNNGTAKGIVAFKLHH